MADDFLSKTNHRAGTLSANGQPDGELSFLNRQTDGLFPFGPWMTPHEWVAQNADQCDSKLFGDNGTFAL